LYLLYGVASIGGVLGSLGLLLRRRWAVPVYLVALIGLVLQVLASYAVTPAWSVGGAASLGFPVLLVAIAVALWLFARRMAARGGLRGRGAQDPAQSAVGYCALPRANRKSVKAKRPSRRTVPPCSTRSGCWNMGPSVTRVWNSPSSPHGSQASGSSDSNAASKRRPA